MVTVDEYRQQDARYCADLTILRDITCCDMLAVILPAVSYVETIGNSIKCGAIGTCQESTLPYQRRVTAVHRVDLRDLVRVSSGARNGGRTQSDR